VQQHDPGEQLMRRVVRFRTGARGQTLVEFALIAPVFILILLAIFDIGRGVFAYTSATNAAREGARLAIVNQDTASIYARIRSQSSVAENNNGDGSDVTVEFLRADASGNPIAGSSCVDTNGYISIGCLAVVRYETTFQPITPVVRQILFSSGVVLTAETVLPVEFTCPNSTLVAASCPKQP
jgi:Flp pilus assembly protein TadG